MLSSVKSWWSPAATAAAAPDVTEKPQQSMSEPGQSPSESSAQQEQPQQEDLSQDQSSASTKDAAKEVLHAAKDWGAYIYTFGKRATTTVTSKAKQLASAPNIVEDFDRKQREFVTAQAERKSRAEAAVPPWVGFDNEEQLREQILALSRDTRNFLRSPPQGANFAFDIEANSPVAMATLEVDENLRKMRFDLVPKRVREDEFWRNYFYRVSLIRQSSQLSALARSSAASSASAAAAAAAAGESASTSSDAGYEKVSPPPQQPPLAARSSASGGSTGSPAAARGDEDLDADCGDFASSELANQQPAALSNVERRRIGADAASEEWEAELQRELKEFELVGAGGAGAPAAAASAATPAAAGADVDEELEREILEQLGEEK